MRGRSAVLGVLTLTTVLAGCLGGAPPSEPLDPQGEDPEPAPIEPIRRPAAPPPSPPSSSGGTPPSPAPSPPSPAPTPEDPGPQVVVAHVDTGINPYHRAFRDPGPLGERHPSTWLPGFPADAPALRLSLDAATYEEALQRDVAVWEGVERGKLYWIPGTRIVGAISLRPGGVLCPQPTVTAPTLPSPLPPFPPGVLPAEVECPDRPILDDHGHGTMTASRMAAATHSLCPTCRIVTIEGLGAPGVAWAAAQGWIDVQSNSWGSIVPATTPGAPDPLPSNRDIRAAFAAAAQRMMVFAASGNGLGFEGVVGEPTWQQATASAGVLQVGAHDNARMTLYHGAPPHVVADGYGGWRAAARHLDELVPSPEACCTSAASPYAAGGAAAVLLEARRVTGHRGTGFPDGVGARGAPFASGPLQDGNLTLAELRRLVLATASARPAEGADDGLVHWAACAREGCRPQDPTVPGENPYCTGCWALPARWADVPAQAPAPWLLGYGAIDAISVDAALRVLRGEAQAPDRAAEDAFFAADAALRGAVDLVP